MQSWGGSSPLQGITQPLPKHWFGHTQIRNFPAFPCGWVPWVSPSPAAGSWGRCWGRGGLVLHTAQQPWARKGCNKWSSWCLKPISGVGFSFFALGFYFFFFSIHLGWFSLLPKKIFLFQDLCTMLRAPWAVCCLPWGFPHLLALGEK